MTHREIESSRQRLSALTTQSAESEIKDKLQELAREIGASTSVVWIHPSSSIRTSDARHCLKSRFSADKVERIPPFTER